MFRDRPVHPDDRRAPSTRPACRSCPSRRWSAPTPSSCTTRARCRFDDRLGPRLSAARTIVVTHENFLRPGGAEGFDVGHCLDLVAARTAAAARGCSRRSRRRTARPSRPGSPSGRPAAGRLAGDDWPNIVAHRRAEPTAAPRDRRGRHSRPGFEKFPPLADLRAQFPAHAERCAHPRRRHAAARPRRRCRRTGSCYRFGAMPVDGLPRRASTSSSTSPTRCWRESFGRAIAEAIAAGKLVITDPATAATFGPGVIADDGSGVDAIVAAHVADPRRYAAAVRRAQADLAAPPARGGGRAAPAASPARTRPPMLLCETDPRRARRRSRTSRSSRASSPRSAFPPGSRPGRCPSSRASTSSSTSRPLLHDGELAPGDALVLARRRPADRRGPRRACAGSPATGR